MAISIRNPRVERLARDLAHRKGTTMTEVIVEALEASLAGNDGDYIPRRDALAKIAAECAVLPVDSGQAEIAMAAWRRFGKGRHPAGLNLGDCAAYALASTLNDSLLYKGGDFSKTDVASALVSSR